MGTDHEKMGAEKLARRGKKGGLREGNSSVTDIVR